jgi:opacity protein-like surface antigen
MFKKSFSVALIIGVLATGLIASAPATADGWWGRGSVKDRRAAVPVPAPAPIPDYAARWYLRGDFGVGFSKPDPSENGMVYGQNLYQWDAEDLSKVRYHWLPNDTETTFIYGGGIGYYWTPHLRTDITIEKISERKLRIRGTYNYEALLFEEDHAPDQQGHRHLVSGETDDKGKLDSGLFLFNAYFDLARNGPLTPYVGAGVGFAVSKLSRTFANYEYVEGDSEDNFLRQTRASGSTHNVTFAAALMAGVSYSITPVTMLDLNYRYLYISGSDIDLNINGVKSNFSTGDIHEHQVRVGLRWNIQ